jgi:uncharacterized protein
VRLVVGDERSSILLQGQVVRPRRTLEAGYVFRYPHLDPALADLVRVRTWTAGRRSCCART